MFLWSLEELKNPVVLQVTLQWQMPQREIRIPGLTLWTRPELAAALEQVEVFL